MLATTDPVVRWHIVSQPEITKPEQLKGKRLGVSGVGAMTHFCAKVFAEKMGWNPDQDLSIMTGSLGVAYLKNRAVDAIVADETASTMAQPPATRCWWAWDPGRLPSLGRASLPPEPG